jgi:hypothetical protein
MSVASSTGVSPAAEIITPERAWIEAREEATRVIACNCINSSGVERESFTYAPERSIGLVGAVEMCGLAGLKRIEADELWSVCEHSVESVSSPPVNRL